MCINGALHTKHLRTLPCSAVFKCQCTDVPPAEGCKVCNRECQAEGRFVSGTCDKQTYRCQCKYPDPLPEAQRNIIISEHNRRRTNMTRGRETGGDGKLPQGSNVFRLTWDKDLELLARRLASVCKGVFNGWVDEIPNQGVNVWRAPRKVGPVSAAKQATAWWWSLKENFFVKEMDSNMEVGQDHVLDADCYP
ncbi:vespid allergen antigen, partial [Aphelenchoides avenae]